MGDHNTDPTTPPALDRAAINVFHAAALLVVAALVITTVAAVLNNIALAAAGNIVTAAAILVIYLLPTIIAVNRGHRKALAIGLTNVFLGWTLVGWGIALIWSCASMRDRAARS